MATVGFGRRGGERENDEECQLGAKEGKGREGLMNESTRLRRSEETKERGTACIENDQPAPRLHPLLSASTSTFPPAVSLASSLVLSVSFASNRYETTRWDGWNHTY